MSGRRKKGAGSISSKPRADGLIPGYVTLPDGNRKRVYGRTPEDVERKINDELRKIAEGRPAQTRDATVTAYLNGWVARRRLIKKGLAASTVQRYEEHIRLHVAPTLGARRVSTLVIADLERLYTMLRKQGLSGSTIHRVHSFLHVALKDAERRGEILRNPCDLIDPPSDNPRPRKALDTDAVILYLQAAGGDDYEALWITAAETGLRQGQLFALRIEDLDLDDGSLGSPEKVRRVIGEGMKRSAPKTENSNLRMAIGGWAVAALRMHLAHLEASGRPNPLGLVWPNLAGGHLEPQNFNPRVWRPFLKAAGIDEATQFRALTRKVHASVAVAENVDAATLRSRMGHADAKTTLDHYVLAITDADRQAARRIDTALRKLARQEPSKKRRGQDRGQSSNGLQGAGIDDSKGSDRRSSGG